MNSGMSWTTHTHTLREQYRASSKQKIMSSASETPYFETYLQLRQEAAAQQGLANTLSHMSGMSYCFIYTECIFKQHAPIWSGMIVQLWSGLEERRVPASACTGPAACGRPARKVGGRWPNLRILLALRETGVASQSASPKRPASAPLPSSTNLSHAAWMLHSWRARDAAAKARKGHRLLERADVCSQCR